MAMAQPPLGGSGGNSEAFHHPPPPPCGIPPPHMPLTLDPTRPGGPHHPAGPGSFSPPVPHAPAPLGTPAPPHGGVPTDGPPVPYHGIPGHFNGGHPLSHPPTSGPPLSAGGFSGPVPPPPPPHPLLGSGPPLHQQPQQGAVPPSGIPHHGLSVPPLGSDAAPSAPPMMGGGPPPPQPPPLAGAASLNGNGTQPSALSNAGPPTSVRHPENVANQPTGTAMANPTNGTTASTAPAPIPPNRTLYVNNLNSKIKLDQLKRDLRSMFENFGVVRDIVAMSSFWRRGQAWVIFGDQESADKALTQLQGFPYANKEMRIQYAREVSDIFTKEEGTFVTRPPGPKKPRAIIEREKKLQAQLQQFQQMMLQHMQQQAATSAGNPPPTNPSMSQSLQAASAIAAQVQQAMQPAFGGGAAGLLGQQRAPQQPGSAPTGALAGQFVAAGGTPTSGGLANGPSRMPLHHGFAQPGVGVPGSIARPDGPGAMPFGHAGLMQQHGGPPCMPGMGRGGHLMGSTPGGAGHPDMKAVPPPAPMSKDAVVAAAAAAAAAAVGAAAKKRAMGAAPGAAANQPPPPSVPNAGGMGAFNPLSNYGGPASSAGHQDKPHPGLNNNPAEILHPPGAPTPAHSTVNEAAAVAASLAGGASARAPLLHNPSMALGMEESDFGGPAVPNRTLCVENLPENCNTKMLEMVFRQYAGCGDIRHIASRRVAFVDYETVAQSSLALRYLNNFPITENHHIKVSFARH